MRAEDILPDDRDERNFSGTSVRKGTVGAFLANAKIWRDPKVSVEMRAIAERDMIEALPALRALGLFDEFTTKDEKLRALIEAHSQAEKGTTND